MPGKLYGSSVTVTEKELFGDFKLHADAVSCRSSVARPTVILLE